MCYYARTDYECRDWKWGNMMLRCPRQHRIGETCGAKLVHSESVTRGGPLCKTCEEIEIKKRRYKKTCDNIQRWDKEPDKFSASLEKARREARELVEKISELHYRRPSVASNLSLQASTPSENTLPPISMTTASSEYGYVSQTGFSRRQEQAPSSNGRASMYTPLTPTNVPSYTSTTYMGQHQQGSTYPRTSMLPTAAHNSMTTSYTNMSYSLDRR